MPSHDVLLEAVQAQPAGAVTAKLAALAVAGTDCGRGPTVYVHDGAGAASCVTVTLCPATVNVPTRGVPSGLVATA